MNYIQRAGSFEDQVGLYFVKTERGGDFRASLLEALMFAHEAYGQGETVIDICRVGSTETFDWRDIRQLWSKLNLSPMD